MVSNTTRTFARVLIELIKLNEKFLYHFANDYNNIGQQKICHIRFLKCLVFLCTELKNRFRIASSPIVFCDCHL